MLVPMYKGSHTRPMWGAVPFFFASLSGCTIVFHFALFGYLIARCPTAPLTPSVALFFFSFCGVDVRAEICAF